MHLCNSTDCYGLFKQQPNWELYFSVQFQLASVLWQVHFPSHWQLQQNFSFVTYNCLVNTVPHIVFNWSSNSIDYTLPVGAAEEVPLNLDTVLPLKGCNSRCNKSVHKLRSKVHLTTHKVTQLLGSVSRTLCNSLCLQELYPSSVRSSEALS